jgi:hypothetical protein
MEMSCLLCLIVFCHLFKATRGIFSRKCPLQLQMSYRLSCWNSNFFSGIIVCLHAYCHICLVIDILFPPYFFGCLPTCPIRSHNFLQLNFSTPTFLTYVHVAIMMKSQYFPQMLIQNLQLLTIVSLDANNRSLFGKSIM